ncbi:MAG: GNAT family N-acetyltransferase [Acidimicrobiales bacterium]|jgi:GNAT superfamily N-acetyltransferase
MPEIEYRLLEPESAGEVLTVQRAAFLAEARLYGTTEIPPLVETLEDMRHELATAIVMGAVRAGRLVGAGRLTVDGEIGWVSRLAVAPDQQANGIGSGLLGALEAAAPPEVRRYQLAAGHKSGANVAMYERRGYREFSRQVDSAGVELVLMGKDRN